VPLQHMRRASVAPALKAAGGDMGASVERPQLGKSYHGEGPNVNAYVSLQGEAYDCLETCRRQALEGSRRNAAERSVEPLGARWGDGSANAVQDHCIARPYVRPAPHRWELAFFTFGVVSLVSAPACGGRFILADS
jgi:hypothetical protein